MTVTMKRWRGKLRRVLYAELAARPELQLTLDRLAGDRVCIAIATRKCDEGVAVLIRGHIAPHFMTRMKMSLGFLKREDESRTYDGGHPVFDDLAALIERDAVCI